MLSQLLVSAWCRSSCPLRPYKFTGDLHLSVPRSSSLKEERDCWSSCRHASLGNIGADRQMHNRLNHRTSSKTRLVCPQTCMVCRCPNFDAQPRLYCLRSLVSKRPLKFEHSASGAVQIEMAFGCRRRTLRRVAHRARCCMMNVCVRSMCLDPSSNAC
jgi:hypothetical protein